jgi:peptidoglycan/LPS O-acetylase OafA/YrhL
MDNFSKEETNILKGVAILFMLYLHLFNKFPMGNLYTPLLYVGAKPFTYLFTSCTYPVDLFMILSGYGLYISYCNGKRNNVTRNLKLYIHYWITLLIFVSLGCFIKGYNTYPGGIENIFLNVTALKTTYNSETWFIFPYILLSLSSPIIFKILDRFNPILMLAVLFSIALLSMSIVHFNQEYVNNHIITNQITSYFSLLFPFSLGMYAAKCLKYNEIKSRLYHISYKNVWLSAAIILLMCTMMFLQDHHLAVFQSFYAIIFILFFILMDRPKWLNAFLKIMGRRSTSLWLVHTFFCYYLFRNFIYGFKYPILIYSVLLACSYITAMIIDLINTNVQKLVFNPITQTK